MPLEDLYGARRQLAELCDRILAFDERIRFAMIANERGSLLEWKTASPLLIPSEQMERLAGMWAAIIVGLVHDLEKYFGTSEAVSLHYEKLDIYGFFADTNEIVVITARKDLPLQVVRDLKKAI